MTVKVCHASATGPAAVCEFEYAKEPSHGMSLQPSSQVRSVSKVPWFPLQNESMRWPAPLEAVEPPTRMLRPPRARRGAPRGWWRCQRSSSQRRPMAAAHRGHTWTTRPASVARASCTSAQSRWDKGRRTDRLSGTPHSVWSVVPPVHACTTPAGSVDPSGSVYSSVAVPAAPRMGVTYPPASHPHASRATQVVGDVASAGVRDSADL
jgi:hypothetical protein